MISRPIVLSGQGLGAGAKTNILQAQYGLDDYPNWSLTARLQGAAGGTLDVYLQTQDYAGGPWSDLAHLTQLAANAAAVAYRLGFSRGFNNPQIPAVPQVVNTVDNTPALGANVYLPWANGASIRLVIVEGVGVSSAPVQTITGMASDN